MGSGNSSDGQIRHASGDGDDLGHIVVVGDNVVVTDDEGRSVHARNESRSQDGVTHDGECSGEWFLWFLVFGFC